MNICIIEDNIVELNCIKKMSVDACKQLNMPVPTILLFSSPEEFYNRSEQDSIIDVCFLDVDLHSEDTGIDVAKRIKEINYNTLIVFMTVYDDYFRDMIQVEPFRFLSKPFRFDNFYKIFNDINNRLILKKNECKCSFIIKINGINFVMDLNTIIYIYSYKRKIFLVDRNNNETEFYEKLDNVEQEIKSLTNKFIRINKSYLINIDYIDSVGKNTIRIQNTDFNISPKYKNNIPQIIT